jgi:hypothetical protein
MAELAQGEAEDVAVDWPTSMILPAATASPANAARRPELPAVAVSSGGGGVGVVRAPPSFVSVVRERGVLRCRS